LAVEQTARRSGFPRAHFEVIRRDQARWVGYGLVGLVALSAIVQIWLASRIVTPWILIDELIYSDLARSLADTGTFHVRGEPIPWSNFGYVVLIAPAWFVTDAQATAYALAKTINVGLGVVALVLVYFWARRMTTAGYAALATGLTALMPSLLYAGTLMSENGFLPSFLLATLAIALALERPTLWRQALAFAAIGLACFVRVQGIVLFAVLPTAVVLASLLEARIAPAGRRLRAAGTYVARFWPSAAALVLLALAYVALKVAQGQPLSTGLGGYQVVAEADYSFSDATRWLFRSLADLSLATAMFPVAALIVLIGLALIYGAPSKSERAFVATALAAIAGIVIQASLFASSFAFRIEERNMFCVFPLLFVAFALWLHRGAPRRPWPLAALAASVPAALVAFALPLRELLGIGILSDTFALIPLLRLSQLVSGGVGTVIDLMSLAALVSALLFFLLPARLTILLPLTMVGYFLMSTYAIHGAIRDYAANLQAGTSGADPSWIDREVGGDQPVDYFYGAGYDAGLEASTLWQSEFWNRSLDDVYNVGIAPPYPLIEVPAPLDRGTGQLQADEPPDRFVVTAATLGIAGVELARNGQLALYRITPPPRVRMTLEGVYGDGWTGAAAALTQYVTPGDRPMRLRVKLSRAAWTGRDLPGGAAWRIGPAVKRDGRATISRVTAGGEWTAHRGESRIFTVQTPPPPYRLELDVSPTFSPSRLGGGGDSRELGVQLDVQRVG
jgi:hypothetical protein